MKRAIVIYMKANITYRQMILAYTTGRNEEALSLAKALLEENCLNRSRLKDAEHIVKMLTL